MQTKVRAPRPCLEMEHFDEHFLKTTCEGLGETPNLSLHASNLVALIDDMSERNGKVAQFYELSLQEKVTELTNALLRQFAFRAYRRRRPDIVPAFNSAFPRTAHSVTCKLFARALLHEMGLTEERRVFDDCAIETTGPFSTPKRVGFLSTMDAGILCASEREDTVLEQLARHVLRNFFLRLFGGSQYSQYDSPNVASSSSSSSSIHSSNSSSSFCSCCGDEHCSLDQLTQGDCNMFDVVNRKQDINSTREVSFGKVMEGLPSELYDFFEKYPTEDERVFALATALLNQHVMNPYMLRQSKNDGLFSVTEKDVDIRNKSLTQMSNTSISHHGSYSGSKKEEFLKFSPEQRALIGILESAQDDVMSLCAFTAIFEMCTGFECVAPCTRSLDSAFSQANSTRSLCQSATAAFIFHGELNSSLIMNEAYYFSEVTGEEGLSNPCSVLFLYLKHHLQRELPSIEKVTRRMILIERDYRRQPNCSASFFDNSSAVLFSPMLSQGGHASNSGSLVQSVHYSSSKSNIVSVRSMEGMTLIGRGASGELFATRRLDTGELVAVKRIYVNEESRRHVEKEVSVLKHSIWITGGDGGSGSGGEGMAEAAESSFSEGNFKGGGTDDYVEDTSNDHRAVVTCYEIFFEEGCAFIVMELMDSGSLMDALNARHGCPFNESECCAITFQVLHGLRYLHDSIRQLHRDLKPHNILLDRRTGAVKLTDFGLSSNQLQSMGFNQCGTYLGTLAYMSPNRVGADSIYGKESDFWSLGITLLQLALGRLPFTPNIFTIASFRRQPPRLPSTIVYEGKKSCEECKKSSSFCEHITHIFSKEFQDFIAVLLPAAPSSCFFAPTTNEDKSEEEKEGKEREEKDYDNDDDETLTQLCGYMTSAQSDGAASLGLYCDENNDDSADSTRTIGDVFEDDVGSCTFMNFCKWSFLSTQSLASKCNLELESSSILHASSFLPTPVCTNDTSNNNRVNNDDKHYTISDNNNDNSLCPTEDNVYKINDDNGTAERSQMHTTGDLAVMEEITATTLLRHPWLRSMTWSESRSIISSIVMETVETTVTPNKDEKT